MKVAFFLHAFPVFSETFVSQELLILQNLGIQGQIWSEKQNSLLQPHSHIKKIEFPVESFPSKIFGEQTWMIIKAHSFWIKKKPLAYLSCLWLLTHMFTLEHVRVFIKSALVAQDIKRFHPDLIYVHEADSCSLYALICKKLCNIPVIIIFHTYFLFHKDKFLKIKIQLSNKIIFQSKYSQLIASQKTKIDNISSKSIVIGSPGVIIDFFYPDKQHLFSQKNIKLIAIGRLEEAKGFHYLVEAISILKKQNFLVHLDVIGDGSLREKLTKLANDLNLNKEIDFHGFIPHSQKLLRLMQKNDIFILPSVIDRDGVRDVHPNAVKEAMSCGLLVITSKLGGISEIIKRNNGILIDVVNAQTLSTAIKNLQQQPLTEKEQMAIQARKTIEKKHDSIKVGYELLQTFYEVKQKNEFRPKE